MPPFSARQTLATFALAAAVAALVLISSAPPAVRGADAPPAAFSAARARADIAALSELGPHPVAAAGRPQKPGHDAAHEKARAHVEGRMRALGLDPIEQVGDACGEPWGRCARVRNLLGRIVPPGTAGRPAVLLLAHYDSVPMGPGAGDDAAGVAVVLEVTRALIQGLDQGQGDTLRRPLIVVVNDGEEAGLLGARVFMTHPWASEVGTVLNFEARGTGGQTAMFETSERSAWLVEEFARAAARPVSSSVIYSLYKTLPNDTDLTITKAAGLSGLNFAFADEEWNYHTPQDSLAFLDLRSVQHMGDQALAVARRLTQRAELPAPDADAVWFDLFTLRLVVYRAGTALWLAVLQAVLFLAACGLALRRGTGRTLGLGVLRWVAAVVVAVAVALLVRKGVALLTGGARVWASRPLPTFLAVLAGASAAGVGVLWLLDRLEARLDERQAGRGVAQAPVLAAAAGALGALLPLTVASLLLALKVPGASYPFTLPALAASAAGCVLFLWIRPAGTAGPAGEALRRSAWGAWALLALGPLCGAVLWFPLVRIVRVMVGVQVPPAIGLCAALLLLLFEPLRRLMAARTRRLLPIAAGAGALAAVVAAVVLGG